MAVAALVLGIIGTVFAIIPGLFVALGIGASVVSFISPLPDPVNKAGPILAAWFSVGVGYFVYLRVRHR